MDLHSFKSHASLGSLQGDGSSSWGWVSDDGREFALIGQGDGTAFIEILEDGSQSYLGRLPQQSLFSRWREIRTYKHYAIIGSEAVGHGIQIFDLKKLLDLDPATPKNFSTVWDLTGHYRGLPIGRTHNVNVNEESNWMVAVGAQPRNDKCAGGLIYIDLTDPSNPTSGGCAGQDAYVHDAECLVYRGPDKRYVGKDICYGYNEDTLTIYDATNRTGLNTSTIISRTSYDGATYTHQGAVLDRNWQEFLIMDDEIDERNATGPAADGYATTYIWDIRDLENPKNTGVYKSAKYGIDHNQYVWSGLATQSNYGAGLRILDVSGIPQDPTGGNVEEVAFFDVYPEDDALPKNGTLTYVGSWSHYAGYPSGHVMINTIERGVFIVKRNDVDGLGRGRHYRKPRNV